MNIAAWIATLGPSLIRRILASLGFGIVVISGLTAVGSTLTGYVQSTWAGLPADMLAIVNLAGLGAGANIILGAIAARLSLYVLTSSSRVVGL